MREKVLTTVVTFGTTTQAIAMERECKKTGFEVSGISLDKSVTLIFLFSNFVSMSLIPVPREISASCGLAWKCAEQGEEETDSYMKEQDLEYERIYRILI